MEFRIVTASAEEDSREIESLLHRVYVTGGFTEPAVAGSLFAASAVLSRGHTLVARDLPTKAVAGMVIVVPPNSPARRLAGTGQVEMHLLAVAPEYRRAGLGSQLVESAIALARDGGYQEMILWTQPTMTDAQRLYRLHGFERAPARDFEKAGRQFLVMKRHL